MGSREPDTVRDSCGVYGVWGHPDAPRLVHYGLYALQHRGQESAGIVASDGSHVVHYKGMGLVSEVFNDQKLEALRGHISIGHVRYSTSGSSRLANAQPVVVRYRGGLLALAHNGNLVNAVPLRGALEDEGSIFQTTVDTEVIAHLVARSRLPRVEEALPEALNKVKGGYALIVMNETTLLAARDPNGFRPLCVGRFPEGGWVVASETCALDATGAEFVREVRPGELLVIDETGLRSTQAVPPGKPALCVFEYIYLARPDSNLEGRNVHVVRKDLGRRLALDYPVEADIVTGVPDSSISAASGYAEEAGIAYELGLVKNRYIGRTFIQPSTSARTFGVQVKLNPLRKVLEGQRVVLVDDSIVRGTTSRRIVNLLRQAGATEVHMRIASPPYRYPCYYGIDTSAEGELIASTKSVEEIAASIGADSLHYLTTQALHETVTGLPDWPVAERCCMACFTGHYPVPVDEARGKFEFEETPDGDDNDRPGGEIEAVAAGTEG
ncbi:MAG: amidophosphoribosyltransferase [Bacillota bacterium]|nr:MAG: amidophosphoribosyltransferase [Bacillota bacterium]